MSDVTPPANLLEVYAGLEAMHGQRHWHWWPDADPFEVIVGAILVQNTAWANVERALDRLRAAGALDLEVMRALSSEQIEECIRPSGQFRQKAKKLAAFLALVKEHGSLDELLALQPAVLRLRLLETWGIGEETADAIILYAARKAAGIADAYMMRLGTRLGVGPLGSTSYAAWQAFVRSELPDDRDVLSRFHAEVVQQCKLLCRKRQPKCAECLFWPKCPNSPQRLSLETPAGER